jgi:hypothetical protein
MCGLEAVGNHAYNFIANSVDLCSRLVKQTDGLQLISQAALTALSFCEYIEMPFESPIKNTLKTITEVISARKVIPRLNEITSGEAITKEAEVGHYNFMRFVSRIAYVVQDAFRTVAFLEKLAVIAAGTGTAISMFLYGMSVEAVVPIIGFVGVALDLADTTSLIMTRGLTWDSGLNFVAAIGRIVAIGIGGAPAYALVGIMSAGTTSLVYFIKFIKSEYKI